MSETKRLHIPEVSGEELVAEGPSKINSAFTTIDAVNHGQQDYLQAGVVSSEDWSFTATIVSSTGDLGSEAATGGVAWLPDPEEHARLMRSVTSSAKLESLKGEPLPASGKYATLGIELTASHWGGAATVSVKAGTEYSTQAEAEAHSPATTEGKIRIRDVVVENASGVYSIVKQTDRRPWARGASSTRTIATYGHITTASAWEKVEIGGEDVAQRVECSGSPVEVVFSYDLGAGSPELAATTEDALYLDGTAAAIWTVWIPAAPEGHPASVPVVERWVFAPAAGSHLFDMYGWGDDLEGHGYGHYYNHATLTVRELRQSANNGTS